jgi:hypothetical protein
MKKKSFDERIAELRRMIIRLEALTLPRNRHAAEKLAAEIQQAAALIRAEIQHEMRSEKK